MDLNERIDLLIQLGKYMLGGDEKWLQARTIAHNRNSWFTHQHIDNSVHCIVSTFLQQSIIENWLGKYNMPKINQNPLSVGVVMAGNIPLVGFHDFLCTFITGHQSVIKLSSKDNILLKHLIEKMYEWNNEVQELVKLSDTLKGCDAYIATGSNNSSRYFEYYFSKYPHIIRRNRTSVAILNGKENIQALEKLADDICLYFGLGCRNVTHIFVPPNYNFTTLLEALKKYTYFIDFYKYKNNYDYQLALHLLNNTPYMSNGSILLLENKSLFSPIAQLHYSYYQKENDVINKLPMEDVQCVIGYNFTAFGTSQQPSITDYADGVDTIQFLLSLNKQKK